MWSHFKLATTLNVNVAVVVAVVLCMRRTDWGSGGKIAAVVLI